MQFEFAKEMDEHRTQFYASLSQNSEQKSLSALSTYFNRCFQDQVVESNAVMSPKIERQICSQCDILLIPGQNCTQRVSIKCHNCGMIMKLPGASKRHCREVSTANVKAVSTSGKSAHQPIKDGGKKQSFNFKSLFNKGSNKLRK
ncbi:hypothetical protein MIR68_000276 [Amoeboaphelidium protococcarum]|nr:hypothetical protein MIR68_000276 [Amoeboaphelidium protococcarum]